MIRKERPSMFKTWLLITGMMIVILIDALRTNRRNEPGDDYHD